MINTYELEVRAMCPIHADLIDIYRVTVRSNSTIEVERIIQFFAPFSQRQVYQETLTAEAATALGAQVQIVGIHSNVTVRSVAP